MTTEPANVPKQRTDRQSLPLVLLGVATLALAALAIFALTDKGGDRTLLPAMAEKSVILPNGTAIYAQKFEVTVAEWNRCFKSEACDLELRVRPGWDPETTPATGLSYLDVDQYVHWISRASGHRFRLPTVAEWKRMAKDVLPEEPDPLFTDPSLTWASAYLVENLPARALKETGSFPETPEGVVDLSGSVWEWTKDCYTEVSGSQACPAYYAAGEHMAAIPYLVRDPARGGCAVGSPPAHLGFRLVSDRPVPLT